jgi:hypothetical protein
MQESKTFDGPSEDRILERNCAAPTYRMSNSTWPENSPQIEALLPMFLDEAHLRIFLFNKVHETERLCPACMTRYKRPPAGCKGKVAIEQELSGICSSKCFAKMVGPESEYEHGGDWDVLIVGDELIKIPKSD